MSKNMDIVLGQLKSASFGDDVAQRLAQKIAKTTQDLADDKINMDEYKELMGDIDIAGKISEIEDDFEGLHRLYKIAMAAATLYKLL